jgi:hypothetical protein
LEGDSKVDQVSTRATVMTAEEQKSLWNWWQAMDAARPVVRRLCSLASELRIHPEASHVDGMILFYRAVSEVSYGHAGTRGGIRRAFGGDYTPLVQANLVMCLGAARQFSDDTKVLLERVAKQVTGGDAQRLIQRLRETLRENDEVLQKAFEQARAFFGPERFQAIQMQNMMSMTLPMANGR